MSPSHPPRYELSDPSDDSCGPRATMELSATGPWVSWDDYLTLWVAHDQLLSRVRFEPATGGAAR